MRERTIETITADQDRITVCISGKSGIESADKLELEIRAAYEKPIEPNVPDVVLSVQDDPNSGCQFLSFDRKKNENDLLFCKLFVYEKEADGLHRLQGPCFSTLSDKCSNWDYSYPTSKTIKGLQVKVLSDALKLGLGHAALNVNLPCIVQSTGEKRAITFPYEGKTYYFNRSYMEQLDQKIKALSDQKTVVNLIIINRAEWHGVWGDSVLTPLLLHPAFRPEGVVSAFHVTGEDALLHFRACMEFLAERYMRPDGRYGRACGWIIGNEVNSPWIYSNCGEMEMPAFLSEYEIALRSAFYAVRKHYANARVYVSLDHCWNKPLELDASRYYKGRDFLEELQKRTCAAGDFDWGVAYHPFPEDLSRADFWNDKTAEHCFAAGKITFKNIEILPAFLKRQTFLYKGRLRHIILSEQGLCSGVSPESEKIQADAFVLAYYKIKTCPEIDAFIYHSHIDEKNEGLFLGLIAEDGRKKPIYDRFVRIDDAESTTMFQEACANVGEKALEEIGIISN